MTPQANPPGRAILRTRRATARLQHSAAGTLVLLAAAAAVGLLAPAASAAQTSVGNRAGSSVAGYSIGVGDRAEAWYATSAVNTCGAVVGCLPSALTNTYPANTLHVGFAAGKEQSRTYIVPNLAAVPVGARLDGGLVTLPVDTATGAGTTNPSSAVIEACLTTSAVTDGVAGSTATPPTVNCATSAPVTYVAAKKVFTVPLAVFAAAWRRSAPKDGIALVPDTSKTTETSFWWIAFDGKALAGPSHVTSSVIYTLPRKQRAPTPVTRSTVPAVAPVPLATVPPAELSEPPGLTTVPPTVPRAPQVAPTTGSQAAGSGAGAVPLDDGFRYPLAFLAPLFMLGGAIYFARLFTRDATPLRLLRR